MFFSGLEVPCRLVPISVFCDVKESVLERGVGGKMHQRTKTGKICQMLDIRQIQDYRIHFVRKRSITCVNL